uniref:Thrombospondin type 1 domain-containing protein n=1 Tax=Loa loa TaxID=7209 RepID=A0A1I7VX83_LOALO
MTSFHDIFKNQRFPASTTAASASVITIVTPSTVTVTPETPQSTVSVTGRTSNIPTVRPFYSDWTAWSCTESCGGCSIGRRTRICFDATMEVNGQSCNQHPCSFGKGLWRYRLITSLPPRTNQRAHYRLGQINGHFVCLP